MKGIITVVTGVTFLLGACKSGSDEKTLEVSGKITHQSAKKIYLEEIPMTTMERILVDSADLGKDGKYKLKTETGEARVYNLRLDQSNYPLAAVINDAGKITVNATFSKENLSQFPDSYEVQGSAASQEMKEFMTQFNNKLQLIIADARQADSLGRAGASDSLLQSIEDAALAKAAEVKALTMQALEKSSNPALSMFILGYYQSTANFAGSGLQGLSNDEVKEIVNATAKKFPSHQGVIAIQSTLSGAQGWVGQTAPEFALPDPNGKEVKLSSFRGKYVLVDFWASWCRPCREENPNVVKAYQKFKDKNFTILGVSFDQPGKKDAWLKAVMQDGLVWTQVSDLSYWNSPIVPLYRIESIPYNILIDPEGKIIAESLRGEDLEKKLTEVLK